MDSSKPLLTTPVAVLIGSVVIALAIFISGGKVQLKNVAGVKTTPTPNQLSGEEIAVNNLKAQAKFLGLDQKKFEGCLDSGEKASLVQNDLNDGAAAGVGGTPAFFINGHRSGGALSYPLFKELVEFVTKNNNLDNPPASLKSFFDGDENNGELSKEVVEVGEGDIPFLGDKNAPVTIVEFSDYQCPYCSRFYQQTLTQFKKEYVDSGKAKLYFRDFPLSFHEGAQKAAEAVRCAGDQGKYWELHNLIFENQEQIFQ